MARAAWGATLSGTIRGNPRVTAVAPVADPVNGATVAADNATVAADAVTVAANVATLVADGASPTQAHVNTLNTNWGTLSTDLTALLAELAGSPTLADVVLSVNLTNITTRNQLRAAINHLLQVIEGSNAFTP